MGGNVRFLVVASGAYTIMTHFRPSRDIYRSAVGAVAERCIYFLYETRGPRLIRLLTRGMPNKVPLWPGLNLNLDGAK